MKMSFRCPWMFVAGAVACVVGLGQPPATSPVSKSKDAKKEVRPVKKNSPSAEGVRVFMDPETHKIRQPTQEEIRNLSHRVAGPAKTVAAAGIDAAPQVLRGPEEAIGLEMDENSMSYMVATKSSKGQVAFDCVTGKKAATARVDINKESPISAAKKGTADDR